MPRRVRQNGPRKERKRPNYANETVAEWEGRMLRKGIPRLSVWFARITGEFGIEAAGIMEDILVGRFGGVAAEFDLEVWRECYLHPKKVGREIWRRERSTSGPLREIALIYKALRQFSRELKAGKYSEEELRALITELFSDPEFVQQSRQAGEEMHRELNKHLEACQHDPGELVEDTLSQFFVTVWLPCMFLLGTSPHALYQRAAEGDMLAVRELIQLDSQAKYLPEIARHTAAWERQPQKFKAQVRMLEDARSSPPNKWKNPQHFKLAIIKYVIGFAQEHVRVGISKIKVFTKRDLQHLFDALSRERLGNQIDEDLPLSDEAYKKALKRHGVSQVSPIGWAFLSDCVSPLKRDGRDSFPHHEHITRQLETSTGRSRAPGRGG